MPDARERQRQAKARYKERHPERVRAQARSHARRYYAANREAIRLRTKLRTFGLTREEHDALVGRAAGRCEVCRTEFGADKATSPHIDHCHDTGAVRGLLCAPCNWALGNARDDPSRLRALADYLEASRAGR